MAVTLNTNSAAYIALANLRTVQTALEGSEKRISTGYVVSDALDNGAVFGVAQFTRSQIAGNSAVSQELGNFSGLVQTASAAATQISNDLSDIRAVLSHLSSTALDSNSQQQYATQLQQLVSSISNFIRGAQYGSTNLLSNGQSFNILADHNAGNNISISGTNFNISTPYVALNTLANASFAVAQLPSFASNAQNFLQTSFGSIGNSVSTVLNFVGALNRSFNTQLNFNATVRSALNNALGSLVDADLTAESANLTALQVKQSLSTQALTIANQGPSSLLRLFQ
ncbi:MAG: flagellin [Candidatus Pacebacteria bacterium]|nr:flagellin [Candidatus Paceibacterota bacterium]